MTQISEPPIARDAEAYRKELTAYCYRMLGSGFEAEDAAQETLLRAWRNRDRFEGRSSFRLWLYRIATNVCLDMLRGPQRRALAVDLGPSTTADRPNLTELPQSSWVLPVCSSSVLADGADPSEVTALRDSIRMAFVAALQHLPPTQRAVLILRDVLCWQAGEVAELLETSLGAVNSSLHRGRATLNQVRDSERPLSELDEEHRALLHRYVELFEAYDVDALVQLLHDDARFTMPPYNMWLNSPAEIKRWMVGPGIACSGSRLLPIAFNGSAGFAAYRQTAPGVWTPWSVQALELSEGRIAASDNYLYPAWFEALGLPAHLTAG